MITLLIHYEFCTPFPSLFQRQMGQDSCLILVKRKMHIRKFRLEDTLVLLLLLKWFISFLLPLSYFAFLFSALLALKFLLQGFNISIFGIIISFALVIYGQAHSLPIVGILGLIAISLTHFYRPICYDFPRLNFPVGFRQDLLSFAGKELNEPNQKKLYYAEFFPIDTTQPFEKKRMRWHFSMEIQKMLNHVGLTNLFLVGFLSSFVSYINGYSYTIAQGAEQQAKRSIVFSHGRGATPFMYSQFLLNWAARGYKVGAVQHTQVSNTHLQGQANIKHYREREVKERAAQLNIAARQVWLSSECQETVLVGHSYGCATAIEAYHSLTLAEQAKITQLVLLDPWFYPLTEATLQKPIHIPVLILATEDFITFEDMFQRNMKFIEIHPEVEYVVWKDSVHLHQTDMGYVCGNLLNSVQKANLTEDILTANMMAVELFFEKQSVQQNQTLKKLFFLRDYMPRQFHQKSFLK